MNKKALLKEIRKHPEGDRLLNLGYGPSFVQKLILEDEAMDEFEAKAKENPDSSDPSGSQARRQKQQADQPTDQNNPEDQQQQQNNQVDSVKNVIELIQNLLSSPEYKKQINKLAFSYASYASYVSSIKNEDVNELYENVKKQLFNQLEKQQNMAIEAVNNANPEQVLAAQKEYNPKKNEFFNFNGIVAAANEEVYKKIAGEGWPISTGVAKFTLPYPTLYEMFKGSKEIEFGGKPSPVLEPGQQQDTEKDVSDLSNLISGLVTKHEDNLDPELTAAGQSDKEVDQTKAGQALASVADPEDKLDQGDVKAFETDPEQAAQKANQTFKQQAAGEDDPFAELKQQYGESEFMKAVEEEEKAVIYKFLNLLKTQGVLSEGKEEMRNFVKSLKLDPGKLGKVLRGVESNERKVIIKYINNNNDLFIKMLQSDQQAPEQEPTEKIEQHKKEALGNYAESYTAFHKDFMKVTYLKDQGKIFRKLYDIILVLADKKTEDIDRDRMAYSDADPTSADALQESLLEEGKEEIIELYQKALIPQTNKMQRNTDKIMDILKEYEKYVGGEKDKIKSGSKALFQKYGEMDPKKLLFKVLQMTMKDIANLEEILDQYESIAPDTQPTEETDLEDFDQEKEEQEGGEQEELEEVLLREEKGVKEIIAEVKAVYLAIANKDTPGRALLNRAKDTATGKEREDNPVKAQSEMEESILREVYNILREEDPTSPDTQRNIKDLALQVYEEMVKIRGYFPNVSPFGTDYGMSAAIEGLTKTLEGFNDIVLDINNVAKDRRVLGDISELKMKLNAIKENLKRYFGVDEFTKKAKKAGAMNDEGQKSVENGEAEPTQDALEELTAGQKPKEANQANLEGLAKDIILNAKSSDDVVKEIMKFFGRSKPGIMQKMKSFFSGLAARFTEEMNPEKQDEAIDNFLEKFLIQFKNLETMAQKIKNNKGEDVLLDDPSFERAIKQALNTLKNPYNKIKKVVLGNEYINNAKLDVNLALPVTKYSTKGDNIIMRMLPRQIKAMLSRDFYKGIMVAFYLISKTLAKQSKTVEKDTGNVFLNKYSGGDREKLKILQLFFDVYKPEDFSDVEQDFSDPSKLEEQIIDSVIRILLKEDSNDTNFLEKVKQAIDVDVAKRVLENYKRFILNTKEVKDKPELQKWLLNTLIQMATEDTSEFTKLLKPSDSDVYDQAAKEASLEDAIKDVSRKNKKMAELLNQFFNPPKEQEEGGDEDLPQNVQGAEDEYRRKTATDDVGTMGLDSSDDEPLEEKLRVSGFKERGDEAEAEFFGDKSFKSDKIKQILLNSGGLPDEIKDYTISYFEKSKLNQKDKDLLMYGISTMLKDYKELFVKTLSSIPSLKRATTKREMTEKQKEALKFFFTAYNKSKNTDSDRKDTADDGYTTMTGSEPAKYTPGALLKPKGEPESLEITGKKKFQENIRPKQLIKILNNKLSEKKANRVLDALKKVKDKYEDGIFQFVKQEVANQVESGEFGKDPSAKPDVPEAEVELDDDDKPEETQGLDKYAKDEKEEEILNEFFKAMKELNENFNVEIEVLGSKLAQKIRTAIGKINKTYSKKQIIWLQKTLIKMVKEDRELFDQQAGTASANPEATGDEPKEGDKYKYVGNSDGDDKDLKKDEIYEINHIDHDSFGKHGNAYFKPLEGSEFYESAPIKDLKNTEKWKKVEDSKEKPKQEQIERKLEIIIENYINNRKQKWRKRTM